MKVKAPGPVKVASPKPEAPKKMASFGKLLEPAPMPLPLPMGLPPRPVELDVEQPQATAAALPSEQIVALANEIGARIEPSAVGTVTIRFDAKTFEGLEVQLSRERGQLAVRLVSQTPEVAQLLTSRVEDLRHRLEERGYRQAIVQVQRVKRAAAPPKEQEKPWR
jgi:flagellar hook-length control protein FliK